LAPKVIAVEGKVYSYKNFHSKGRNLQRNMELLPLLKYWKYPHHFGTVTNFLSFSSYPSEPHSLEFWIASFWRWTTQPAITWLFTVIKMRMIMMNLVIVTWMNPYFSFFAPILAG